MKSVSKSLKIDKNVTTIKLEHSKAQNKREQCQEIKAVYLLLGAYNEIGRHINVDTYRELKQKFDELISTTKHLF